MTKEKTFIKANCSIEATLKYLQENNIEEAIIVDNLYIPIGTINIKNILYANNFNLKTQQVSLITNYFEDSNYQEKHSNKINAQNTIEKTLSEEIKTIINTLSDFANKQNIKIYIVGGIVRDLLRNQQNLDIDFTVESNGIEFAKKLADEFSFITLKEQHEPFGTAKIIYSINNNDNQIDIASTRKEHYSKPGALPSVDQINCSLDNDLYRRDFTINAMAISINKNNYGEVIDLLKSTVDLKNKTIRVIHPLSFIDDPTRIIRGIKFATRFNYKLSNATQLLIKETINSNLFDNYCCDRLKLELKPTLNLNNLKVIKFFENYKLYRLIDKEIPWGRSYFTNFELLKRNLDLYNKHFDTNNTWLIYLAGMLFELDKNKIENITNKLNLNNIEKNIILNGIKLLNKTIEEEPPLTPSEIYEFYNNHSIESLIISTIKTSKLSSLKALNDYLGHYSKIKIDLTGEDLKNMGFSPGPLFSEILNTLLKLKLDKKILNKEQEINFVKNNYSIN